MWELYIKAFMELLADSSTKEAKRVCCYIKLTEQKHMYHLYSYDFFFLLDISVIKLSCLCSAQKTLEGFFSDGWNKPLPNLKHIARTLGSFHSYPDIFKSANFSFADSKISGPHLLGFTLSSSAIMCKAIFG